MRRDFAALELILSALALAGPSTSFARGETAAVAAASPTIVTISFKLDPRLSGPTYGGERWVSPPTYTGAAAQDVVDARVQATDVRGMPSNVAFKWIAADPDMVSVSPTQGQQVKIAVKRTGESKLKVASREISKELLIKAKRIGGGIQVEIVQLAAERPKVAPAGPEVTGPRSRAGPARESWKALARRNKEDGEAFLVRNRKKAGVVTLPSGLQYKVLGAGEGATPADADTVAFHYRGTVIGGKEVADTRRLGRPATLKVAKAIPGCREALKLMPVGSRWQLFVPPQLAYGERGVRGKRGSDPGIAPNATLILEVELLAIKATAGDRTAAVTEPPRPQED